MTAAHCFSNFVSSSYRVLLNVHNITDSGVNTDVVRMPIVAIIPHNLYFGVYQNDIALVKLSVIY